jgi:signal transduction histidine kinase
MKNGIEAMADGGRLSVEVTRPDQGWVRISICDTGIGMSEANMDRAMVPFFTTKTYGTGMGLTLVERIVKGHKGFLSLQAREIGGMQASVDLPLLSPSPGAAGELE